MKKEYIDVLEQLSLRMDTQGTIFAGVSDTDSKARIAYKFGYLNAEVTRWYYEVRDLIDEAKKDLP